MKHLIIIGARGFGREVYNTALESIGYGVDFDIKGFLDDKLDALDSFEGYPAIISSVENYTPESDDVFICALGEVKWKKYYTQMILDKGGDFITLIHKQASISKNVKVGLGSIICNQSIVSCDVNIGKFSTIQPHVLIGHDNTIGEYCQINSNSTIGGNVNIGDFVTIHTSAVILPKAKIGELAIVGAGSVVLRSVPTNTTVFGNPAKKIPLPKV